jgi:DNA-binding beta-propeller fold protein YncE
MANEVINLNTVFSGFNSGTDLQPKNTRANNQGVTINDIAGFIKIVSEAPTEGTAGDMVFNSGENKLYVCVSEDSFVSVLLEG